MKIDKYVEKKGQTLRYGYTTGSCATAAAKAAAEMLLSFDQKIIDKVELMTPKGILLFLDVHDIQKSSQFVSCAIQKDSGDDPDTTNGMLIYVKVAKTTSQNIEIDGGVGIGRVTKEGLNQPVGNAAINDGPRKSIKNELEHICEKYMYDGGLKVTIFANDGEERALKTFNSKLGIIGGISILGTTGIVEPMSEQAIIDTIYTEINVKKAQGHKYLFLTPGNYGRTFSCELAQVDPLSVIKCSNFIGDSIVYAKHTEFDGIVLVGHIGKLIKLCGNIFNTHSWYGDCRAEIFAAYAGVCGASKECIQEILQSATTDEMVKIAKEEGIIDKIMQIILYKIMVNIKAKITCNMQIEVVIFSQKYGLLTCTDNWKSIIEEIKNIENKEK